MGGDTERCVFAAGGMRGPRRHAVDGRFDEVAEQFLALEDTIEVRRVWFVKARATVGSSFFFFGICMG